MAVLAGLLLSSHAHAAPAYGPKLPERNQFHLGFQSHTVFERELYHGHGEMRSQQQFLLITYGITDWLSLDLKAGGGDIEQENDSGSEFKYPTYLAGGYGFRIKLLDKENTRGVFGFQHISAHPRHIVVNGVKHKAVLDDWQFSFLISHQLGKFEPYAGVRWSRMDHIHWADNVRKRVRSDLDKSTGAILGFNLYLKDNVWLNVEGNAFDTEALAAGINFHF
ncbi:MAG TPA: hypothetical protein VI749_09575 [Candidatus Omnitrophota bacterium]|nr:hypothetical protein [Candidatus Omnitrophota bacterium]